MELPTPTPAALHERPLPTPTASAARALPAGTWLNEFEIGDVIGEGSVAIVYAATHRAHAAQVAIAEYIPARLAQRNGDAQVTPRSSAHADAFARGLNAFVREARALARCDHPSLARVACQWQANATAYCAMPRYRPRRLLEARREMAEPPSDAELRALLDALLGALEAFHRAEGCHGNVTPSNILLQDDKRPLLLGPGAASRAIGGDEIDGVPIRGDPSFAPFEQVVETDIALHPSVDLYALAGVARYWMSGQLPPPIFGAPGAARRETVAATVQRLQLTWPRLCYSASLVGALESALSVYPAERPQSVAEMRARLDPAPPAASRCVSAGPAPVPPVDDAGPSPPAATLQPVAPSAVAHDRGVAIASVPDPDIEAISAVARSDDRSPARTAFAYAAPKRGRIAMWSGALLILLTLLVLGAQEIDPQRAVGTLVGVLGIGSGGSAVESAAPSTSVAGAAAPVTAPSAAVAGAAETPIESNAVESVARDSAPAAVPATDVAAPAHPESPDHATPTAAAAAAAVSQPPEVTAAHAAKHVPASPREACGARTQFSMYRCMQAQCSQPRWAAHAQCEHLRATDSVD